MKNIWKIIATVTVTSITCFILISATNEQNNSKEFALITVYGGSLHLTYADKPSILIPLRAISNKSIEGRNKEIIKLMTKLSEEGYELKSSSTLAGGSLDNTTYVFER